MIESGTARKYITYAIGEILLVMIGILLALQVNNWNESRQTNESTKTYLHGIIEDLNADLATLKRVEEHQMFRSKAINYILKLVGRNEVPWNIPEWTPNPVWNEAIPDTFDRSFLKLSFGYIQRTNPTSAEYNSSSFEEMNNIGLYSFIKNRPLKNSLNSYYKDWDGSIGSEQLREENEWIQKWYDVWAQDGIYHFFLPEMEDPLSPLSKYPYRGVILTRISAIAGWRYYTSVRLQKEARRLITQIEEEIEKY